MAAGTEAERTKESKVGKESGRTLSVSVVPQIIGMKNVSLSHV